MFCPIRFQTVIGLWVSAGIVGEVSAGIVGEVGAGIVMHAISETCFVEFFQSRRLNPFLCRLKK